MLLQKGPCGMILGLMQWTSWVLPIQNAWVIRASPSILTAIQWRFNDPCRCSGTICTCPQSKCVSQRRQRSCLVPCPSPFGQRTRQPWHPNDTGTGFGHASEANMCPPHQESHKYVPRRLPGWASPVAVNNVNSCCFHFSLNQATSKGFMCTDN